jgi:hypothetical protein
VDDVRHRLLGPSWRLFRWSHSRSDSSQ